MSAHGEAWDALRAEAEKLRAELARVKQECESLHATVQDLAKANDVELQQEKEAGALSAFEHWQKEYRANGQDIFGTVDDWMTEWRKREAKHE